MSIETEHSREIGDLVTALAAFQAKLKPAVKEVEGQVGQGRYKYADLAAVWGVVQPGLGNSGLAVVQVVERIDGEDHMATTIAHTSGQYIRGRCPIQAEAGGRGTAAQQYGSAMTYARRYGLTAMLGIVTDDDDGASAPASRQPAQIEQDVELTKEEQERFVALCVAQGGLLGDDLYTSILSKWNLTPETVAQLKNKKLSITIAKTLTTQAAIDRG